MTEIEQLKAELERVRRQAAAMREALQGVLNSALHPDTAFRAVMVPLDPIRKALSDAGSDFFTREQVQLIIGPLAARHHFEGKPQRQEWMDDETFRAALNAWEMANRALEEARTIGLTP